MKYIFTKRFFDLSTMDQSLVVDAALRELDQCWLSQEDEDRAKRQRQRIERKAIRYGIWEEGGARAGRGTADHLAWSAEPQLKKM